MVRLFNIRRTSSGSSSSTSSLARKLRKHRRFAIVGLSGAGKTKFLLELMKLVKNCKELNYVENESDKEIVTMRYKKMTLYINCLSGDDSSIQFWRQHFHGLQGLIFILDVADFFVNDDIDRELTERGEKVKFVLQALLIEKELQQVPVIIFGNKFESLRSEVNKIDLEEAIKDVLEINAPREMPVCVKVGSVISNSGLIDTLDWLTVNSKPL